MKLVNIKNETDLDYADALFLVRNVIMRGIICEQYRYYTKFKNNICVRSSVTNEAYNFIVCKDN